MFKHRETMLRIVVGILVIGMLLFLVVPFIQ
jgi:hypothetical protein